LAINDIGLKRNRQNKDVLLNIPAEIKLLSLPIPQPTNYGLYKNFTHIPQNGTLASRVIASYLLQKIQTKREKYSVKKKQSSKRRKGYYLKKVSE
jgi:hypothetical protein